MQCCRASSMRAFPDDIRRAALIFARCSAENGGRFMPFSALDRFALCCVERGPRCFPFPPAEIFALVSADFFSPRRDSALLAATSGESFLPFLLADIFARHSGVLLLRNASAMFARASGDLLRAASA